MVTKTDPKSNSEIETKRKPGKTPQAGVTKLTIALERAYGLWKDLPESYFAEINERVRGSKEIEYIRKLKRGET